MLKLRGSRSRRAINRDFYKKLGGKALDQIQQVAHIL
jgi:hypothetical protein